MSNPTATPGSILGPDFLGPDAYLAAFGELPTNVPPLNLTAGEIQQIRDRKEQLVLMLPNLGGKALTMEGIYTRKPLQQDRRSRLLFDTSGYRNESFFTTEIPKPGWRIVGKTPIGLGHDYQGQTEDLIAHLQDLYPTHMPPVYQQAVQEYEGQAQAIRNEPNWKARAKALATLQINQLLRHSAPELLLHLTLHNAGTTRVEENLLCNRWSWMNSRDSVGRLVLAGNFDSYGACVYGNGPVATNSLLGVLSVRNVTES